MDEFLCLCLFKHSDSIVYTRRMTTQCEHNEYIKCKGCKCKYSNDDEHIKQGFGYNRLGEQFKT